jgi:hypothetical protein
MGRFGANVIVFVLNNDGYLIEPALEENPNWSYNDLAPWRYAELPRVLGCADWFTARVATLGELDAAMKAARKSESGAYIEIVGDRMDMPPILAFAHGRLGTMYGDAPYAAPPLRHGGVHARDRSTSGRRALDDPGISETGGGGVGLVTRPRKFSTVGVLRPAQPPANDVAHDGRSMVSRLCAFPDDLLTDPLTTGEFW